VETKKWNYLNRVMLFKSVVYPSECKETDRNSKEKTDTCKCDTQKVKECHNKNKQEDKPEMTPCKMKRHGEEISDRCILMLNNNIR
jgi:hypothetical protein